MSAGAPSPESCQARSPRGALHAVCPAHVHLVELRHDRGILRRAENVSDVLRDGGRQRVEQRPHRRHGTVRLVAETGVVVEAACDGPHADGGALEAGHGVLVATELRDVAPVADVPPRGVATVADRFPGLIDEPVPDSM